MAIQRLKANSIDLAYESFGHDSAPAILLIAGLGTQMIRWTSDFCEALVARGYRVIRFDNRDTGCSTHFTDQPAPDLATLVSTLMAGRQPQVPYTLHDMTGDAIALLDALGIESAHIVGRSMGGMIAQLMASDYPQRVRSLTSIMSSTGNPALPPAAPDVMGMMMRPAPDPTANEMAFIAHGLAFARRIAGTGHAFDESVQLSLLREEVRRAHVPGGFARHIAALAATGDLRPRLATLRLPALVIHGLEDPLILPACGQDTAASIPGAELLLIEGMGHDLPAVLYPVVIDAIARVARQVDFSDLGRPHQLT